MKLEGRVWKFGDSVGATDIVSARYDKEGMNSQWAECAKHVFEDVNPELATKVQPGDILVAGTNLGTGHAHYYTAAIMGCKFAGFGGLLAERLNGLFQRAAIDQGVPALSIAGLGGFVNNGDHLEFDLVSGAACNHTTGATRQFAPLSPIIIDILSSGGSLNWALRRVGADHAIPH